MNLANNETIDKLYTYIIMKLSIIVIQVKVETEKKMAQLTPIEPNF